MLKRLSLVAALVTLALVGCTSEKTADEKAVSSSDKDHLLKAQQSALEKAKNVEAMTLKAAEKQAKAIEEQSQ